MKVEFWKVILGQQTDGQEMNRMKRDKGVIAG